VGEGRGQGGEMTQTMCVHVNKLTKKNKQIKKTNKQKKELQKDFNLDIKSFGKVITLEIGAHYKNGDLTLTKEYRRFRVVLFSLLESLSLRQS
jgi:hypothetical protein